MKGHERLNSMVIKLAAATLCGPINNVMNLSITKTTFCPKWKIGKIVPLYKGKPLDRMQP